MEWNILKIASCTVEIRNCAIQIIVEWRSEPYQDWNEVTQPAHQLTENTFMVEL